MTRRSRRIAGREHRRRIALVTDAVLPFHVGGKEARYAELASGLKRYGDVHVYTLHWWKGSRTMTSDGVTFHAVAPLVSLYRGDRRSVLEAVTFAIGCLGLLFAPFDVLEADHMPYMQLFTLRLVTWIRRKRLVVTWHEVWGPDYWRAYLGPLGVIGWWFERTALSLPDAIVAASPGTARRLGERLPRGPEVVTAPNGVHLAKMTSIAASGPRYDVVAVGRLLPHKRIDMLLQALAILRDEGIVLSCKVVGNGSLQRALSAQANELGLTGSVEFLHDVASPEDLYGLMKAARVFAFPSEREGFGAVALEALACGLPVVTTSAPDNLAVDLVRRSARSAVCAPDARSLADSIRQVLKDEGQRAHGEVEPWLKEYDWNAVTRAVAHALRLGEPGGRPEPAA